MARPLLELLVWITRNFISLYHLNLHTIKQHNSWKDTQFLIYTQDQTFRYLHITKFTYHQLISNFMNFQMSNERHWYGWKLHVIFLRSDVFSHFCISEMIFTVHLKSVIIYFITGTLEQAWISKFIM